MQYSPLDPLYLANYPLFQSEYPVLKLLWLSISRLKFTNNWQSSKNNVEQRYKPIFKDGLAAIRAEKGKQKLRQSKHHIFVQKI
jgi:hypothetical protein